MRGSRTFALALVLAVAAFAAGCGSSSNSSSGASGSTSSGSASSTTSSAGGGDAISAAVSAASAEKAAWTAAKSKLPASSPPAAAGRTLVAVSCSIQIEGCRALSQAHVEAAKALGWKTTLLDGRGNAQGWSSAVQAAIQLKPNVIALGAILPTAVGDLLRQAQAQGIRVVCTTCGATSGRDNVDFANGDAQISEPVGRDSADYALSKGGKKTDALVMYYPEFGTSIIRRDAFLNEYRALCPSCKSTVIAVRISEWGTSLPGRIQSLLQQDPGINWIFSPADETAVDSTNAIRASGLTDRVKVVGGNGERQSFQTVASDPSYAAVVATSYFLAGWEAMDNANRIVQGSAAAPLIVQANRLMDQSNVSTVKPGQYWSGDFDFRAAYEKLWRG
ncbi:MAG: periplasmic binding domain protein [Conexibacter sp.]|nr:periplasmic binding domain protein [Conexibacter sp.]